MIDRDTASQAALADGVVHLVVRDDDDGASALDEDVGLLEAAVEDDASAAPIGVVPGEYVVLAVSDDGVGMDADTQAHIFEPFFTTKDTGKGTGLGLSTVYGIVKQSSGHIDVRSKPGQGSTFTIYLPRIDDTREVEKTRIPEDRLPEGRETVLLVEDEFGVRVLVQYGLRLYGYTVLTARDGDEAIRISKQHAGPIHLLVTDIAMPRMNGRQLAHELAARHPKMKVLFISGEDAVTCGGENPEETALLQKPFTPDVLARKMRELLDQRS